MSETGLRADNLSKHIWIQIKAILTPHWAKENQAIEITTAHGTLAKLDEPGKKSDNIN